MYDIYSYARSLPQTAKGLIVAILAAWGAKDHGQMVKTPGVDILSLSTSLPVLF